MSGRVRAPRPTAPAARGRGRGAPAGAARGGRGGRGAPPGARGGRGGRGAPPGTRGGRGGGRGAGPSAVAAPPRPQFEAIQLEVPFVVFTPQELNDKKTELLNMVSAAMLSEPKASASSPLFMKILETSRQVAYYDPEFLLKLALYVRQDLNIRSTANYLLAMSSNIKECQPFIAKYYDECIRLPSDWLEVVAIYATLPDRTIKTGIPSCLRKAMIEKFPSFDEYQLGKYNKERNLKRKQKKLRDRALRTGVPAPPPARPGVTLKQMIRQLHMSTPPFPVMALLGKRYPSTMEEFRNSGLPGVFKPELAATRIKLPVPETWETMLSEKGNKASTWESLIDHKKLPFMAMLRNLRNLIVTGVSMKHHKWAQSKLSNEDTIAMSRQFPFRFFSAYEVIPANQAELKKLIEPKPQDPSKPLRVKKNPIIPKLLPTDAVLDAYREALDQSVKHATTNNVDPIKGATVVFCNVSKETRSQAPGAKGMGGAVKQVAQLGYLLGLMCKYVCEECDFRIWSSPHPRKPTVSHLGVELQDGTILANMAKVAEQAAQLGDAAIPFPGEYIENLIANKKKIDNLLILSHKALNPEEGGEGADLGKLLTKYRAEVNPHLLFVSVNLSGAGKTSIGRSDVNPNNIMISGFSEQILRFIAESGGDGQLQYVENIDEAKGINAKMAAKQKALNPDPSPWWKWLDTLGEEGQARPTYPNLLIQPKPWRDIRVFISSTFLDMHGERDVLTRLVFPELKERCKKRRLNVIEVDLRWGITEEQTQHAQGIQLCLEEVQRSTFFVGMLGERYGWAPSSYDVSKDAKNLGWLERFPVGRSITELEMELAGLGKANGHHYSDEGPSEVFFYLRDKSFIETMPEEHRKYFEADSPSAKEKMYNLKKRIVSSGLPVRRKYPASWRGIEDGKAMVGNLTTFGDLVFADLWAAIERHFPAEEEELSDEIMQQQIDSAAAKSVDPNAEVFKRTLETVLHERSMQQSFIEEKTRRFFGRKEQLEAMHKYANPPPASSNWTPTQKSHMLVVHGSSGDGKSALLATFAKQLAEKDPHVFVLTHFCSASHGSQDLQTMLTRLCWEIKAAFNLDDFDVPVDFKELQLAFAEVLKEASFKGKLVVILDAVDELEDNSSSRAHSLEWLPLELPCKFIISTTTTLAVEEHINANSGFQYRTSLSAKEDNTTHNQVLDTIRNRKIPNLVEVRMTPLSVEERTKFIRDTLLEYHKRLDERPMNNQMRILIRKTDAGKPVYLITACEELRVFGVYEQVAEKIASLGPTTAKLFESVLQRLEVDHTSTVVESFFVALLASRNGLTEDELLAATGMDSSSPTWQHLMRATAPYLRFTAETVSIFHEQMSIAAAKRYIRKGSKLLPNIHHKIANHLYNQADPSRVGETVWMYAQPRVLAELPYHLLGAGKYQELEKVLTDLVFIEQKAKANLTFDLINDYNTALSATSDVKKAQFMVNKLQEYLAFVKQNAFIIHNDSELTLQQAANEPDHTSPAQAAFSLWQRSRFNCNDWFEWMNKPQAHAACKMTYNALGEAMLATAVSPDGSVLAMAGRECVIKLFNARTGAELGVIPPSANGHTQWIVGLNFSPDSRFLVSAAWDNTAKVWDVPTRVLICTLSGARRRVNDACFSPQNGRYVATASWDNCVRVYDVMQNGTLVKTIREHSRPINCVAFSPDEKYILTGSWDSTIKMIEANLDVSTPPRVAKVFQGHKGSVTSLAMAPNGLSIASSSRDQTVALWDSASGKMISSLENHRSPVLSVKYSGDGQFLATTSVDCSVRVYKSTLGNQIVILPTPSDGVYMTAVVAHPLRSDLFATGTSDCKILIWDLTRHAVIHTLQQKHNRPINCLDWSPDGKWIASCAEENVVFLWNAETWKFECNLNEHLHPVNAVAFNPNSATPLLASSCDGFDIRIWNYKTRTPYIPPESTAASQLSDPAILKGHDSTVKGLCWHPKGKMLASASRDRTAKIWDTNTGKCVKTLRGHQDWLNSVTFSPDGQKVVTGSWDYHVKHWNLRNDESVVPPNLTAHDGPVCQVRYLKGGSHFISAASDGKLIVWDAASGTIITVLHGHTSRINAMCVTSDGHVISVSDDATTRVWAPMEPIEIASLSGHSDTVRSVAFAPAADKYLIFSASDDETVKVWDAGVGKYAMENQAQEAEAPHVPVTFRTECKLELQAHTAQLNDVALSADYVFSAADEGVTAQWDFRVGECVRVLSHPGNRTMRACSIGTDAHQHLLFTGCDDGIVTAWDIRSHKAAFKLTTRNDRAHAAPVTSLSYRNGVLISSGWDNKVNVWDIAKTGAYSTSIMTEDWVLSAKFAPNDDKFVAVGWEGAPYWGNKSGYSMKCESTWNATCLTDATILKVDSQQIVAAGDLDGQINFWETQDMSLGTLPTLELKATAGRKRINCVDSYTRGGISTLISGGEDCLIRQFSLRDVDSKPIPSGQFPANAPITSLCAGQNVPHIFAGDRIGRLYMLETRDNI